MKKSQMRKVPQLLIIVGLGILIASLIWWYQTFGLSSDFVRCIAVSGGICRIGGVKGLFGGSSYTPTIFWIGLVVLVVGIGWKRIS